jgi:hypothetical protein
MSMTFNLYVPSEYTFKNYFFPRIQNPSLEFFEVDKRRYGIQRKGNNHLVVFLDFCLKKPPSEFTRLNSSEAGDLLVESPAVIELFNRMFGRQKEVAVYSLSYNARMSVIAWKLLTEIANDEKIMVEDDSGQWMSGPECVRELKELLG